MPWVSKPQGRGRHRIPERELAVDFGYKQAWDLERLEPNTFFPVASCVVFAQHHGAGGNAEPLAGSVERWRGNAGAVDVYRERSYITDTSVCRGFPLRQLCATRGINRASLSVLRGRSGEYGSNPSWRYGDREPAARFTG